MTINLESLATRTLELMDKAGFDDAQVVAAWSLQDELSIFQNEPSLLRTTEDHQLSIAGIVDGRRATTTLTDIEEGAVQAAVAQLLDNARMSPRDDANAVSEDQVGSLTDGPLECDPAILREKVAEMLDFRARETPKMRIEEGAALHRREASQLVTSRGTRLTADIGAYTLAAFGAASEGDKASSFNFAEGTAHDVTRAPAWAQFGIGDMLRETEEQIDTKSFGGNFVGDVILAPMAVHDLFGWLLEQIGDYALIANASVYKTHVGEAIASPMLDIRSRFDGPGEEPFTGDGFNAPPVHLLDNGKLTCLLPSYYGSRKTGILHTPAASGWVIRPGETPFADLVSGIEKGAIVNRLSMGEPAPNGDFSGVIKNSFKIEGGKRGDALSETMIAGNMARMLTDISGISREYLDTGSTAFPGSVFRVFTFPDDAIGPG